MMSGGYIQKPTYDIFSGQLAFSQLIRVHAYCLKAGKQQLQPKKIYVDDMVRIGVVYGWTSMSTLIIVYGMYVCSMYILPSVDIHIIMLINPAPYVYTILYIHYIHC